MSLGPSAPRTAYTAVSARQYGTPVVHRMYPLDVYAISRCERNPCCGREVAMRAKNDDLHGSAPDGADVALLLIDVINDLEFGY